MDIFRVSFIGHRVVDEYRQVEEELDEVIELLHRKYGFIDFNVGRNGEFDDLATQAVRRFRREWEEWCELTLVEPYPVANLDIIEKSYDSVIIPTDRKCHYKAAIPSIPLHLNSMFPALRSCVISVRCPAHSRSIPITVVMEGYTSKTDTNLV